MNSVHRETPRWHPPAPRAAWRRGMATMSEDHRAPPRGGATAAIGTRRSLRPAKGLDPEHLKHPHRLPPPGQARTKAPGTQPAAPSAQPSGPGAHAYREPAATRPRPRPARVRSTHSPPTPSGRHEDLRPRNHPNSTYRAPRAATCHARTHRFPRTAHQNLPITPGGRAVSYKGSDPKEGREMCTSRPLCSQLVTAWRAEYRSSKRCAPGRRRSRTRPGSGPCDDRSLPVPEFRSGQTAGPPAH